MKIFWRILDVGEALYWFARGHFTLKQVWLVMVGKAKLKYREDF